jgi:hypothetical protein
MRHGQSVSFKLRDESDLSQRIVVPNFCPAQAFPRCFEQQPARSHRILLLYGALIPMVQTTETRVRKNVAPSC